MTNFTPWSALFGGVLIGGSASMLLLFNGRVAGISGIVGGLVRPRATDTLWRVLFVAGLLVGGAALARFMPNSIGQTGVSLPVAVVAGLLVGFGTRLGSGCTSGHGVCGLSRLSLRSLVATLTFMTAGMIAAVLFHLVLGVQR